MHVKDDGTRTRDEVAVLAPSGRDGRLTEQVLGRWGLHAVICPDMAALCDRVRAGVGVLVIAEEALRSDARSLLLAELGTQPSWSDVPVVILTAEGELSRPLAEGVEAVTRQVNATLLERPIRTATLITTVRAALRARARQYDVRDYLQERERLVQAERLARARAVRLQELTAALSVAASVDEVIEAIVEHAANALGASSTVIAWLVDGMVELLRSGEMPDESREAWQRFPLAAEAPLSNVTRTGEPVFLE